MQNSPFISVLMPVYNCENYVFEAVESILQQTYIHFELLIIDDCSTDDTLRICKSFEDERIVIIEKEKNSGYTNSLNYGLKISKGKYIARMDGDDISLPTRFAKQVAFLEANQDVVVCGTAFEILDSGLYIAVPETNDDIKVGMLQECKIGHPTIMMRSSFLNEHQLSYNVGMEPAEDYDLWVRMIHFGKFYNLQEPLLKYRVHQNQVSSIRRNLQMEATKIIRFKLLTYLKSDSTTIQKEVYFGIIDSNNKISFQDFLIFLDFKRKVIIANEIGFFKKDSFNKYWKELESKFISYYFRSQKSYSISNFKEYLFVSKKIETQLNFFELLKFFVKSLINYKV